MDKQRFDALTRALASGGSRRRLLGLALGATGLVAGSALSTGSGSRAARRPTPTLVPIHCPSGMRWTGTTCVCIVGEMCGADCCTEGGTCCDNACCYARCIGEEICCVPSCPSFSCGNSDGCDGTCSCHDTLDCVGGLCASKCSSVIDCECGDDCYPSLVGPVCGNSIDPTGPCSIDRDCANFGIGAFCSGGVCVKVCTP